MLGSAIIIAAGAAIAAVLIFAASKPDTFTVRRTATIDAPPEKIFPLISDFGHWRAWSPYENKDPSMRRERSGAASGQGAVYEWDGNRKVGAGRIEITEAAAPSRISIRLDMIKPIGGHNIVDVTLARRGGLARAASTQVTWAMRGSCSYAAKIMHVLFNMDKMVGKDFELGLANLKTLAESA
jgi:uncharacterized protein YndB with AHSA1/START domain